MRQLAAFLLGGAVGDIALGAACVDLHALSPAESKRRALDNYTEKSPDPGKTCSGCTFFSGDAAGAACGHCQIFNGPANPNGRCDDWTARPA